MAKKTEVIKNTKTKKKTAATGEKPVVKTAQTKSAVTRKPAGTAKAPVISKPGNAASKKPLKADDKNHVVVGKVTYPDATPATGLTVIAYDKDVSGQETLGQPVVTNESGAFAIPYSDSDFRRTKEERGGADVIVCVYSDDKQLLFTSKKKNNAPAQYELNITVPAQPFVVRGKVRFADGTPLAGALVRAYDKDLRSKEPLGKSEPVTTDTKGWYEIFYTAAQFSRAEKHNADLLVEARKNSEADWIAAPIRFNAQPVESVDITLDGVFRGPSEFTRLLDEITPLLDGLRMAELTENSDFQDITFLSNESGVDQQLIVWLAASALRAQEQDLLQHEEYYGLFRQSLPTDLDALLAQETDALRRALENSARDNIVRPMFEPDLNDFVSRVLQLKAGKVLRPGASNEPASLGDLLAVAIDDAEKHKLIAKLFVEQGGETDAFLKTLEKDSGVTPDEVKAVRLALALGTFTANHLPLVRELYQMGKGTATFAELRGFAQLDETEWQAILQRPQGPGGENSKPIGFPPGQESIQSYARTLNQFIETTFPTAVISNRVDRDNSNESPFKETKSDLLVFFGNNPEFSFADTPPDLYLSSDAGEKLRDIEKPEVLKTQLKSMQRVFNITPRYPVMYALLADDLHSATAMVAIGERRFTETYGEVFGGQSLAREAYIKAEHVHATALNVYMKHAEAFNSPTPYVISGGMTERSASPSVLAARSSALRMVPDYTKLFGSLDLCDCRHCQSLYSPAAYLVDILKFLDGGPTNKDRMSPLDVLLTRRPDIEHIELTCENTNTQVPYVDLTNEILEAAIAPRIFTIAVDSNYGSVIADRNAGKIHPWLRAAFASNGYALSEKASLRKDTIAGSIVSHNSIILDSGWAFTLGFFKAQNVFGVVAWPQTSWTSDELRANPEHIHDPAYAVLRSAVYPWNLPLNLPLEEMRVYLGHLGVPRRELVKTFISSTLPPDLADAEITYEYLGLGKEEANIVAGRVEGGPVGTPAPAGAWNFWGLQGTNNHIADRINGAAPPAQGDWDVVLQRVSIFLQQSGLSYKELLELLGTHFINPSASGSTPGGRLLGIVSAAGAPVDTCDRSRLEIQIVDDAISDKKGTLKTVWNRMHRFVRLWRKLGWTMRDLDKAIAAEPANSDGEVEIDDPFLIKLSHIQRLHVETSLPVVNLLSWWADIDTRNYVDQLADGEPTVASLYARLFSNKTVSGQVVGENPVALSGTLTGKAAAIAAALQISVEDFTLLQSAIPNDDALTLANLSLLYRHASLAKALKLTIRSYLTSLELIDRAPFTTAANTIQFKKHIDKIRTSGFTIEDLNYLLRNKFSATSNIAATDDVIATVLDAMRGDLQKVSAENTFVASGVDDDAATSDPNGELTRKKLALLNWDPTLIENAIAVLNDTATYETMLTNLAATVVFPESLKNKISYDSTKQKLRFTGTMTAAEQMELVALPNTDGPFTAAVGELFKAPKDFVFRHMARFSVPVFSVPVTDTTLKLLLAKFKFPEALKNKIYYDTVAETLHFVGVMTEAERSTLSKLLPLDNEYLDAIQALFIAPDDHNNAPSDGDIFLTSAAADNLFDDPNDMPQVRFLLVLEKLLPHLQMTLSEIVVKQRFGEYLKLDAPVIGGLLKKWIMPRVIDPTHPERTALADFIDPVFAESNPNIKPSKDAFPDQFNAPLLLCKIAIFIQKFDITSQQLSWLFDSKLNAGWLDLNALPLGATAPTSSLFPGWERLADLFQLRDSLPSGEALLTDVFTSATALGDPDAQKNKVLEILSKGAEWELGSLKSLSGPNGFNYSVSDFAGESTILRLSDAFAMLKRLGASADQCLSWAKPYPTGNDARELKSVVRAKYDDAQWQELAKSLRDPLRERQRSALVSYLVQALGVRDADDLYDRFSIDVAMSPCMMTTRIKQAISSVQLFIQRALMNLDDEVSLTPKEAQEWSRWRKWYRVWEANRKVLLYPENWIEPELRDDKSPFFKDLENELLQNDVTMDTAETAFLHYLEKLDEVARLEIVGMYQQKEQAANNTEKDTDILHVFGRTFGIPHIYYYRKLEHSVWSAWEKVDLDIEGDHLIPVVWNRRIHLFWPIFTEKTQKQTQTERINNEDPVIDWKIKLAWSEYKSGKWNPKKASEEKKSLSYTKDPSPNVPQDRQDFSFNTRMVGDQLMIQCYGTVLQKQAAVSEVKKLPGEQICGTGNGYVLILFLGSTSPFDPVPNIRAQAYDQDSKAINRNSEDGAISNQSGAIYVYAQDFNASSIFWQLISNNSSIDHVVTVIPSVQPLIYQAERNTLLHLDKKNERWTYFRVYLKPKTEVATSSPTVNPANGKTPDYVTMQCIGDFAFSDCQADLTARQDSLVISSIHPAKLEPIQDTQIQSMQFEEISGEHPFSNPEGGGDAIIGSTPGTFRILAPHESVQFSLQSPFFYQDDKRTFFANLRGVPYKKKLEVLSRETGKVVENKRLLYLFETFYHPYVCDFIKCLNARGISGLLTLQSQDTKKDDLGTVVTSDNVTRSFPKGGALFWKEYAPNTTRVFLPPVGKEEEALPKEDVDFDYSGAYSLYNWELFFHAPFIIATQLSKNQRFEEAQKWFHYIFDPTATDSPDRPSEPGIERFWRVKPFYIEAMHDIQTLEALIADSNALSAQVTEWEADPFKPHVIARMRVVAYMKAVVMRYIDNLTEWGDQLFRRDTIESINEATQLYILAGQILGRRPESIPARVKAKIQTFRTLDDVETLDSLSNAMVEIESFLAPSVTPSSFGTKGRPPLRMRYFCITGNDKLLGYWDTVSDRLFKIRHCMNIEGVERSLPIFEPKIDVGLLVRAAAAGVDISSALNDINAALPHYRFNIMLQKATELCNDVKGLGAALLSALEKKDAEELALLRSDQEIKVLEAVREVKKKQIEETTETLEGLKKSRELANVRYEYYKNIAFMNQGEKRHLDLLSQGLTLQAVQSGIDYMGNIMSLIPDAKTGAPSTAGITFGGTQLGGALKAYSAYMGSMISILNTTGSMSATLGGYQRRQDDWKLQEKLAATEMAQIDKQILAAEIRHAIAEKELENHELQRENAEEIEAYMKDKFTNKELYNWMVGQLSGIYFQSYQMAYDIAKRAERAYRHELGLSDSNFVQFGYWDSLKKGLLAGEKLHYDLKRMDVAYLDKNKREHEITKHISLITIDPISLVKLKETGECFVSLPEALFDIDYPGHYMRRIKSVSLTIPCVTGPYASVNCTLTQLSSSIRHANTLSGGKYGRGPDDTRFIDSFGSIQSIVTSSGQNDSGLFDANLRDERYLPFEGLGAISMWRIQLPKEFKSFDYNTVSDVVLHLRYTARDAGGALRKQATDELTAAVNAFVQSEGKQGLARIFSLRHEFPTEWHRFLNPTETVAGQKLELALTPDRFPLQFRGRNIQINRADIFLKFNEAGNSHPTPLDAYQNDDPLKLGLTFTGDSRDEFVLNSTDSILSGLPHDGKNFSPAKNLGNYVLDSALKIALDITDVDIERIAPSLRSQISVNGDVHWRLKPEFIDDIFIVCRYSV